MNVFFDGELRNVQKREFKRRNGETGFSYPILIECDGRAEVFVTNEKVYQAFVSGDIKKGDELRFEARYSPRMQWNAFEVIEYSF